MANQLQGVEEGKINQLYGCVSFAVDICDLVYWLVSFISFPLAKNFVAIVMEEGWGAVNPNFIDKDGVKLCVEVCQWC